MKYDFEQKYQLLNAKYEDLIENNDKSHRIIKDSELQIQQLESNKTQVGRRDEIIRDKKSISSNLVGEEMFRFGIFD